MLKILLCDDDRAELERLEEMLAGQGQRPVAFSNPADALAYVQMNAVDLCILDILMPGMRGDELARAMREGGYRGQIVFLTSSNEFAAESYAVKAADYIIKPPAAERVETVIRETGERLLHADRAGIVVMIGHTAHKVEFSRLVYAEARNKKVCFNLSDGTQLAPYMTIQECGETLLRDTRFTHCHASFIVNMDYVATMEGPSVVMKNGARLPISRTYSDFKKQFVAYAMRGVF